MDKYRGNPKRIKERAWSAKDRFGEVIKEEMFSFNIYLFSPDGYLYERRIYHADDGELASTMTYKKNGPNINDLVGFDDWPVTAFIDIKHDQKGNWIKIVKRDTGGEDWETKMLYDIYEREIEYYD